MGEIFVDDKQLTLHGLQQHYVKLTEREKNRKLNDLLDALDFNQVVIFVRTKARATQLNRLLAQCAFPSICVHSDMPQNKRLQFFKEFKEYKHRMGRAGRFGTKGLSITFVSTAEEEETMKTIQERFKVKVTPLPNEIQTSDYM